PDSGRSYRGFPASLPFVSGCSVRRNRFSGCQVWRQAAPRTKRKQRAPSVPPPHLSARAENPESSAETWLADDDVAQAARHGVDREPTGGRRGVPDAESENVSEPSAG